MKPTVSKSSVNFRSGTAAKRCGNCVMFHPRQHACDLVKGVIRSDDVCDRWQKK